MFSAANFRHPTKRPGFAAAPDPFARISQNRPDDNDEGINFEDTYDGLGDGLNEEDDELNDDTFGITSTANDPAQKDFDFYGSTRQSEVHDDPLSGGDAFSKASARSNMQKTSKAEEQQYRSGYEAYKKPGYFSDLHVDPSLWASEPAASDQTTASIATASQEKPQTAKTAPERKMLSLEEVEALMQSRKTQHSTNTAPILSAVSAAERTSMTKPQVAQDVSQISLQHGIQSQKESMAPPQSMQDQRQIYQSHAVPPGTRHLNGVPMGSANEPQYIPFGPLTGFTNAHGSSVPPFPPHAGLVRHQNPPHVVHPVGHSSNLAPPARPQEPFGTAMATPSANIRPAAQMMDLTEDQKRQHLSDEARRAKRSYKIHQLSRGNGLMTPQDKNFITRIQLQILMTAVGADAETKEGTNPAAATLEGDFYCRVFRQIGPRAGPASQPPHAPDRHDNDDFAPTYLLRTGNSYRSRGVRNGIRDSLREQPQTPENHMQRMQQQVLRAVEAAKAKPKNKDLVIKGSLGKIQFSNAKTPKPLLNIKRPGLDSQNSNSAKGNDAAGQSPAKKATSVASSETYGTNVKAVLGNIEKVYESLMQLEDHDRRVPPDIIAGPANMEDQSSYQEMFSSWKVEFQRLNKKLWSEMKVLEPIEPSATTLHPFIAMLSYPKGQKLIPRVLVHMDQEQRLTILTIIILQLDALSVVRGQTLSASRTASSPSKMLSEANLFIQTVMPCLFGIVTEVQLNVIIGLVSLIQERTDLQIIMRSHVGVEMLTMLLSQAEIIHKSKHDASAGPAAMEEWQQWTQIYDRLFDLIEPNLAKLFSTIEAAVPSQIVNAQHEFYLWQFLATLGTGANPEQQQRLVLAVKDRVMRTLQQSKTLPPQTAAQSRANVNLFMQAIGLDVSLLDD